jgi:hypothetical protein
MTTDNITIEPAVEADMILRYLLRQCDEKRSISNIVFLMLTLTVLSHEKELVQGFNNLISSCSPAQDEHLQLFVELLSKSLTRLSESTSFESPEEEIDDPPLDRAISRQFLRAAYREARWMQEEKDYEGGLQGDEGSKQEFVERCLQDDGEPAEQVEVGREIIKNAIFHRKGKPSLYVFTGKN